MALRILEIVRNVDITQKESIVTASTEVHSALLDFMAESSALVDVPEEYYAFLETMEGGNVSSVFDRGFDIVDPLSYLQKKWARSVGELLFYCAATGISVE